MTRLVESVKRWLGREPDHECAYNCGEEYPEHCVYCGRNILDDPETWRRNKLHRRENIALAKQGLPPKWHIYR